MGALRARFRYITMASGVRASFPGKIGGNMDDSRSLSLSASSICLVSSGSGGGGEGGDVHKPFISLISID